MTHIHPTAIVDPLAEVAETATIGAYCIIGPEVVVGEHCMLHNHVTIQRSTIIGESNVFYPFSVIGADPQDRKYHGEHSVCEIGNHNQIREHVTIHRGTGNGGGVTRIGNENLIMVSAHIAHDCILGDRIAIANQVMLAGHVRVRDDANIGGGAGIHHFTTIGDCAFVGGLARITKDVPPFMIVEGNPAEVRAINGIAMTRRGFRPEHIDAVKDAFKRLYRDNGHTMSDKIETLRHEYCDVEPVIKLCCALKATAEGLHGRALETLRTDDKRIVDPLIDTAKKKLAASDVKQS